MKRRVAKSWEELRALMGFCGAISKAEISVAQVVGDYSMPTALPMQSCGIQQCRTPHRTGYIIEFPDARVSHVGRDCGKKHFGVVAWKLRMRSYQAASQAQAKAQAVRELVEKASSLASVDPLEPSGLKQALEMMSAFNDLPEELRGSIVSRAQDGNALITKVRPTTKDERKTAQFLGKKVPPRFTEEVLGKLDGLRSFRSDRRVDRLWISVVPARRDVLRRSVELGSGDLASAIRQYESALAQLPDSIADTLAFFESSNLSKIPLLPAASRLGISEVQAIRGGGFKLRLVRKGSR